MEKFLNKLRITWPLKLLFQVLRIFDFVSLYFFNKNNYENERRSVITNNAFFMSIDGWFRGLSHSFYIEVTTSNYPFKTSVF